MRIEYTVHDDQLFSSTPGRDSSPFALTPCKVTFDFIPLHILHFVYSSTNSKLHKHSFSISEKFKLLSVPSINSGLFVSALRLSRRPQTNRVGRLNGANEFRLYALSEIVYLRNVIRFD